MEEGEPLRSDNGHAPPAAAHLAAGLELGARLRRRYDAEILRGTFVIELPTPRTVRALALGGFDFVILDLEHSPLDLPGLPPLISEAHACGTPVLVRPWSHDAGMLGKILDLGVNGVLIPNVGSVEQAQAVTAATRYAPLGARGVCPLIGPSAVKRLRGGVGDVLVIAQIEGREGLAAAEQIAATPGLDGVFVGPYDLAHALGEPGEVNGSGVIDAAETIARVVPDGVMLGIYVDDPVESAAWARRGFRLQCVSFDGRMLVERAHDVLAAAQAEMAISDNGGRRR
jgi:4-hydroxy-2-oxoheptanedioate aldolase